MPRLGYLDRPYLILGVDDKLNVFIKHYLINYISLFWQSKIFRFPFWQNLISGWEVLIVREQWILITTNKGCSGEKCQKSFV